MNIYQGKYLSIQYYKTKSLFTQKWTLQITTIEDFKQELLEYTKQYEKYRPENTLWNQQNFSVSVDEETKFWIEENVNKPCMSYGNKKCAFVVGEDILAHIETIDSFERKYTTIVPQHFATKKKALAWIEETNTEKNLNSSQKIIYDGLDEDGNMVLKVPTANIKNTIKGIQRSIEQQKFIEIHRSKNNLLTKREKEIMSLLSKELKPIDISVQLFISLHTVRTHLKNIKSKLFFKKDSDFKKFIKIFYT